MLLLRPLLATVLALLFANVSPAWAVTGCEKAMSLFTRANFATVQHRIALYQEAIDLCPGYIRPYELAGNLYRKKGDNKQAIELFGKAAELGSTNNKLYYLLAELMLQEGKVNAASSNIKRSIELRANYPKAVALLQKIVKVVDSEGPEIVIFEPATRRGIAIVSKYETISVRGMVTDKSGLAWLTINGIKTPVDEKDFFLKDIALREGENQIIITAQDSLGNRSQYQAKVNCKGRSKAGNVGIDLAKQGKGALYAKSYAVVIGINQYEKWAPLEFAVADSRAVTQLFERSGFDQIISIQDHEATQRRLLTILGHELPRMVGRDDRLVIYFAGHGQTEELANGGKKGYIIPVDADTSNYFATAISMETLRSLSARIPAKHILYVMDSCYSGLGLNRSAGLSVDVDDYIHEMSSRRAVQIITAGGKDEPVEEKQGHGLFTKYFLLAMKGEADSNSDGLITASELGSFVKPQVAKASGKRQTPLYGRLEGDGEVLFLIDDSEQK